MEKVKVMITAVVSALMSWLGILAVPVLLLVGCNIMDYATGICAAKYRDESVNSYKGMRGIVKKVCMYLLIMVGAMVDCLLDYAVTYIGMEIVLTFIVATIVAVWLIVNEIISILENMLDIGVDMPPFLLPLVKNIKAQVEDKARVKEEKENV